MAETQKKITDNKYLLDLRKKELEEKTKELETLKQENKEKMEKLNTQYNNLCEEKKQKEEEAIQIKVDIETIQIELMQKIRDLNDEIDANKKKEQEIMREVKNVAAEIVKMDQKIKIKEEEGNIHLVMSVV